MNRRAASPSSVEHGGHGERTDQDLRHDDEHCLASRPVLYESPDELRNEQDAHAGDEPVTPRRAPVLPLGDEDLRAERGEDAQPRRSREFNEYRCERRKRDP